LPAAWNADSERRVETVEAEMEAIPLPDDSVDQIISNGVINLSPRKARVLAECARVLRPGGRFCVSDLTVAPDEAPPEILAHPATWAGCVSGALSEIDYIEKLERSGFTGVQVLHREPFSVDDCALYPLFPEDLIRLMKRLIAPEKQNAVAVAVVITASR
jgi:arsenite methyltransferase